MNSVSYVFSMVSAWLNLSVLAALYLINYVPLEFMTALDSSDLDIRQSLIVDRFENTCEWVYENEAFVTWLRHERGVFWIYGKPGSGKSTLMKLVHADKRTRQHSHTFGTSSCQISAEFFFNYRGTYLQKTLEGLMRSVLRQIMRRLSQFNSRGANDLLNALLQSPSFRHPSRHPWSITYLEESLRAILEQNRIDLQITFFFDALDEFDGPPEYISRFITYLVSQPTGSRTRTKVCFSSRPWSAFVTAFSDGPKLSVEDFTSDDIRHFCTTTLAHALQASHHHVVPELADGIVLRASGVFLWASLIGK
jgi:hypothetical protein